MKYRLLAVAAAAAVATMVATTGAYAQVTVGVTLPLTGPGAALGVPMGKQIEMWPDEIEGTPLNVIVLDDGGDPATATANARRLVTENKADLLIGSAVTPATIAVGVVAFETETPHFAGSPMPLELGREKWSFVLPQEVSLMARGLFDHMRENGVKTVGYIGYSDSWGDLWKRQLETTGPEYGIEVMADERYARADTSVSGQALKLAAGNFDAVLVGASGTGAALPQIALRERGYQGPIYQTHGAVTNDFIRIAGPAAEGAIFASGPVMVPELQPKDAATRAPGLDFVTTYESAHGPNTRTQFAAHAYDALLILKAALPDALEAAEPGTPEFRNALRDAIENAGDIAASQGVFDFTPEDHYGLDERARVLLTVENGQFVLVE